MNQIELLPPATDQYLAEKAGAIRALAKNVVRDVVEIGRHLAEARERAPHGEWLPWLEREFEWSRQSADRFIAVYDAVRSGKLPTVSNLDLDMRSIYTLAAPSTPEEARVDVLDRAANGEALTHEQVKEIVDKAVEASRADTERQLDDARAEAERREAAVRAEYEDKIVTDPVDLERRIDRAMRPLRKQIETYERKLAQINEREQKRIERERKAQAKGKKKSAGIDADGSLNETAVRRALRDLIAATMKITPDQAMKIAGQAAKATEQNLAQWLDETPAHARAAIAWLAKYEALCTKGVKHG